MSATAVSVTGYTPFLVSVTICAPLWAINIAQADRYYNTYPEDRRFLKVFVGVSVFLNTAQLAVLVYTVYFWLVTCRLPENYLLLGSLKRSMVPSYITYFLTTVVQCFYGMRVWIVSKRNIYLLVTILVLSFLQICGGWALCTYVVIKNSLTAVYSRFNHVSGGIELASSMLCDIVITGSLVYFLRGHVSGFRATRNALNKLILYSVNTGLVTNIVALVNLVTWLVASETDFTWAVFHFALGKIYVNSMLVSLNARETIRRELYSAPGKTVTSIFDVDGIETRRTDLPLRKVSKPSDSQGF